MRLTKKEKELLLKITDHLTDRSGYYEIENQEREIVYNIFKKIRLEIRGY